MTPKTSWSKREVKRLWSRTEIDEHRRVADRPYTRMTVDMVVAHADLEEDDLVVDVGCGWGRISHRTGDRCRLIGIDLTREMLEKHRAIFGNHVEKIVGDGDALPLAADSVDVAYSTRVLQYVSDPRYAIAEMARVLKPTGRALIVLPNRYNPYNYATYHAELYAPSTIRSILEAVGFRDIAVDYFGYSPPTRFIPAFETVRTVPWLRRIGGLYIVSGVLP